MKNFTLIVAALCAFSASAAITLSNHMPTPRLINITKSTETVKFNVAPSEAGPADIAGSYVCGTVSGDNCNTSFAVSIEKTNTQNVYTITNLIGLNGSIKGTYDPATSLLTIAPGQTILNNETYRDVLLFLMPNASTYSEDRGIVFKFDENGCAKLINGHGLVALLFNYVVGQTFSLEAPLMGYELFPVNGNITSEIVDDNFGYIETTEFPTYTKVNGNEGVIYGIDGITWESFTVGDDNAVTFDQSDVYNYSNIYKNAIMSHGGMTENGTWGFDTKNCIGTLDLEEGMIVMDAWCMILKNYALTDKYTVMNGNKAQSIITFPAETPAAISDVKVGNTVPALDLSKPVFNLAGQQVTIDESSRGFFIQNGHKYVK
ncbi:MAG: hypothetical protein KBT10_05080 [Bacteroidales bacterium]|nr:hypothetical protein [Candidatus Sodaliphilus aphodohippi]